MLIIIIMATCGTPRKINGNLVGGVDWQQNVVPSTTYYDSIKGSFVTASNGAALIPIMVAEPLTTTSTYISSSQSRLTSVYNNILQTTQAGTSIQLLGILNGILGNITGIPSSISGVNTTQSTTTSTLTALTDYKSGGTTFSTTNPTFFLDYAPFNQATFMFVSTLDVAVNISVTSDFDSLFLHDFLIGNSNNNPFTVSANSTNLQTLKDKWPLLRLKFTPKSTPSTGNFTAFAILG